MWPSCCATAGVAARTTASSMNQNLNRRVGLGRAVGEKEDRYEQRAFGTDRRRGSDGLPKRQAGDRRGRGERIGVEAERDFCAAGNGRPAGAGGVVKPNLQSRGVSRNEWHVSSQVGVEGIK